MGAVAVIMSTTTVGAVAVSTVTMSTMTMGAVAVSTVDETAVTVSWSGRCQLLLQKPHSLRDVLLTPSSREEFDRLRAPRTHTTH